AILIALLAGLTGWTAFTAAAPEIPPGQQTLEGILDIRHGDDFTSGRVTGYAYFLRSPGRETELVFEGAAPDDSVSGTQVRVHGVRQGDKFFVAAGGTQHGSSPSGSSSVATGAKRVAIVLFNFSNDASQPYTPAFASGVAFTNSNSVAAYYAETSWGQLTLTGDVFGWYTIPDRSDTCAVGAWATSVTTAVAAASIDLGLYDNVVYAFPYAASCAWSGKASMPGRTSWLNGTSGMSLHTMAHELGHNFRTHHASALNCTEGGVRVALSQTCTVSEYGDPFSVMGGASHYQHTNFSRGNFGWLSNANTLTATASGDYSVRPIENDDPTGIQVLRIPRADTGLYLTLEFRQPFGTSFDTFSATDPVTNGVTVRLTADYSAPSQTRLIDSTPATLSFADAPLAVGQTLMDPVSGVSITTVGVSSSGASVRISFGAVPPAPSPTATPTATAVPTPTPDTEAPTTPGQFNAALGRGKKVVLSWTASSDNVAVAGYWIFRDGAQVASTSGTSLTDAVPGKSAMHTYYVVAYDAVGNLSPPSDAVTIRP
ncbi:MAG: hypothetical protein EHM89_17535, partial [Acidobacteria bacterium]